MSSFLSAAEHVLGQRQKVRPDLKKDGGRKQRGTARVGESYFVYFCDV